MTRVFAPALAAALLFALALQAEPAWREVERADGITVSLRDDPEGGAPAFRGVTELDATAFEILAVIRDVPAQTRWMHQCAEARLVRELDGQTALVYNRSDLPWPVADRDVVVHSRWEASPRPESAELHTVLLDARSVAEPTVPERAGIVRMPRLEGAYRLVELAPGRTRVTYEIAFDPGGALPKRLVTAFSRDLPLHTLAGLRRRVAETRGRYDAWLAEVDPRRGR